MCLNLDIFLKIRNDFRSISFSSRVQPILHQDYWVQAGQAGSCSVFIFSPNPDWQQAISLPSESLSLARDKPEDNEPGQKNSVLVVNIFNCWTNIFHTWTYTRRGRNNSMSSYLFKFELKWLLRTKRTREHRGWRSGDSELGWEYPSLNKQDVRARDNDRCSIMLRTGPGHEHSQHSTSIVLTKNVSVWPNIFKLTQHFLFQG